jgi:hypothetical protein
MGRHGVFLLPETQLLMKGKIKLFFHSFTMHLDTFKVIYLPTDAQ